uniref:Uncharacterized protein n=1 Tax=Dinoroseobacter phage vB_DshS_R26L TaxID=3161158 RepID=A0AAU7VHM1_9CAUD
MEWAGREEPTIAVDLWIGGRGDHELAMLNALREYVNSVGLCVTVTDTEFWFTGGGEDGFRIGLRNYPRFPSEAMDLLAHAEKIGKLLADAGDQGSFMIEEHGGVTYWLTRRPGDGASPQEMAECDCDTPGQCSRTGCEATK